MSQGLFALIYVVGCVVVGGAFVGYWWDTDFAAAGIPAAMIWPVTLVGLLAWKLGRYLKRRFP